MNWLTAPWGSDLATRSGIALILVGVLGGVVGVFVVLRGLSFTTEAFAHTAFPGAVVAAAAGGSIVVGGLIATLVAAVAIAFTSRLRAVGDDTAIGIVFTGLFASGALLMSWLGPLDRDVTSFLFGSLLGQTDTDLAILAAATVALIAVVWVLRRPFVTNAFNPDLAAAQGVHPGRVDLALMIVVAVTVVVMFSAVGSLLVLAMLVTPAVTARLIAKRLVTTLALSVMFGVVSAVIGLAISYSAGVATGACVVLTATSLLIVVAALTRLPRRGDRRGGLSVPAVRSL